MRRALWQNRLKKISHDVPFTNFIPCAQKNKQPITINFRLHAGYPVPQVAEAASPELDGTLLIAIQPGEKSTLTIPANAFSGYLRLETINK